ncbi:MAG TPA: MmgE/PrpD family protein, partial [bacterium]|nr:MmgE/PrpD family protein [bacterium]
AARTSPTLAALVNGILGYYCDNEPRHTPSVVHILPAVVPAALSVGEAEGASGSDFFKAVVLGIEVGCRVSQALDPKALYARGFHPTSIGGTFGAATAAGHLLRLSGTAWRSALGLAAQQACGLLAWVDDATEHSRPLNPGLAARNGVAAATWAALGMGGPPDVFEGKYEIFTAFSGVRRPEGLTDGLGSRLLITELAAKRHVSCGFLHGGLDALLDLMSEHTLTIQDIDALDLYLATTAARVVDNNPIKSHHAQYVLAVAALNGRVTIEDILGDGVAHPDVARLSHRITVVYDEELERLYPRQYSAIVVLRTRDGRRLERRVDWPRGWPENPMTEAQWMDKYRTLTAYRCTPAQSARIAELTLALSELGDIRVLGDALSLRA